MATLTRPGVEISQEIITESPTVLTPSLVPCIVGPCYQIVSPITSAGLLNSDAQVTTAAMILSSTAVSDPASLSGKRMVISVNSGDDQTINFPLTLNNVGISHALIVTTINKQLESAVAEIKENKLVIRTNSTGSSSSLKLQTVASNSAYADLQLTSSVDTLVKGSTDYANLTYLAPYSSLPSPLVTDINEIVLQGEDIDVFRYFNNTLTQFSETSAINWTSYTGGVSSSGGDGSASVAIGSADQPAYGLGRTQLFGKAVGGTTTNTLVNLGRSASIIIPLGHDGPVFAAASAWPDVTGKNYLKVSAIGLEPFIANQADQPGAYIGTAGNSVEVEIAASGPGPVAVAWNSGTDTLTVTITAGATTYTELKEKIDALNNITGEISVELGFDSSNGGDSVLPAGATPFGSTFRLAGGVDPTNFSPAVVAVPEANVTGAVKVAAGDTAAQCEVASKRLEVSVDGGDFIAIDFASSNVVATVINTALTGVATCAATSLKNSLGESFDALRITSVSENDHDSTIELRASDPTVIENLFGGFKTRTETIDSSDMTLTANNRTATGPVSSVKYNKRASTNNEKAISRGSVTAVVSSCLGIGSLVFGADDASCVTNGLAAASPLELDVVHSVDGGTTTVTDKLVLTGLSADTVTDLATLIDTQLAANVILQNKVGASLEVVDGEARLVLFDLTGAAGGSVKVTSGVNTTSALKLALDNGGSIFDVFGTTAAATLTYKDSGTDGALQLTTVSNSLASTKVSSVLTLDLDTYTVDSSAHGFEHSTGTLKLDLSGDSFSTPSNKPIVLALTATSAVTLTYSRVHACCTGAASPLYTSRIFHGDSNKVLPGDLLYNNGTALGRVVALDTFVAGPSTFTNAQIMLSEYAINSGATISDWYITAESLPTDDRVAPEATYNDLGATINIKHALVRDGAGIARSGSSAPVYVQYKALRKDVTSSAVNPGLLTFISATEVESLIGPVSIENPLALGLSLAFLNAPSISLSALGIDETSADAPDGTVDSYDRALDFLELKEVYAIAPLTQDREVHKLLNLHVTAFSEPAAKKERMGIVCPIIPTEKEGTLVISGTATIGPEINGKFLVTFTDETLNVPVALNGKTDAGGNTIVGGVGQAYDTVPGIYLDREGDAFKYWVSATPETNVVQIEINDSFLPGGGPGTGGNDDGFYKTDNVALADFSAAGEVVTILVRQAAIDVSTTGGKLTACETLGDIAGGVSGYQNRRLVMMQPAQVGTTLDGTEVLVEGHYLGAAIAAMIGQQNPSQPFTNLPMVGFTRPVGSSDKFSETQMATAAAGGVYWVIQDTPGGSLASRHQLTTDVTSLKTRELSILKAVDYLAKLIRGQVTRFIGRNNITKALLETVSLGISGALANASGSVVASASLDTIVQDSSNPDTIKVEISVTPFYPANTIKITIFV